MRIDLEEIMEVARQTADKSPCKYKVSCVLCDKKGNIIATGYNHYGSRSGRLGKWTIHAEIDAISKGIRKPSNNLVAFIYRRHGRIIHPCDTCKALLKAYGISTIYHTNEKSWERL
jgi:deoxycytidylate deaminase